MQTYKGKSKCSCGRRAKWRVIGNGYNHFACDSHKNKLKSLTSVNDSDRITEADEQSWKQL